MKKTLAIVVIMTIFGFANAQQITEIKKSFTISLPCSICVNEDGMAIELNPKTARFEIEQKWFGTAGNIIIMTIKNEYGQSIGRKTIEDAKLYMMNTNGTTKWIVADNLFCYGSYFEADGESYFEPKLQKVAIMKTTLK